MKIDKNTYNFDCFILDELKTIKFVNKNDFLKNVKTILKKKSTVKLWYEFADRKEWDFENQTYKNINFTCCPQSRNARNYFCLILETKSDKITVIDGFLRSV